MFYEEPIAPRSAGRAYEEQLLSDIANYDVIKSDTYLINIENVRMRSKIDIKRETQTLNVTRKM